MRALSLLIIGSTTLLPIEAADKKHLQLAELAAANQAKLTELSLGMNKDQVIALMGKATAETRDGVVNNPWSVEACPDTDQLPVEVLYYVVRKNQPFTPVRKSLTTAVVLKEGKVVAWGERAGDKCK